MHIKIDLGYHSELNKTHSKRKNSYVDYNNLRKNTELALRYFHPNAWRVETVNKTRIRVQPDFAPCSKYLVNVKKKEQTQRKIHFKDFWKNFNTFRNLRSIDFALSCKDVFATNAQISSF